MSPPPATECCQMNPHCCMQRSVLHARDIDNVNESSHCSNIMPFDTWGIANVGIGLAISTRCKNQSTRFWIEFIILLCSFGINIPNAASASFKIWIGDAVQQHIGAYMSTNFQ